MECLKVNGRHAQSLYWRGLTRNSFQLRVIGILNAKVMDSKDGSSKSETSLSIDHPDKVCLAVYFGGKFKGMLHF